MKFPSRKNKKIIFKTGFTLVEMMVSVGLFSVVMLIAMGSVISIIDGNKKAQAINTVVNNLNFTIDSMVRDIKTGYKYTCSSSAVKPQDPTLSQCNSSVASNQIMLYSTLNNLPYPQIVQYTYDSANKKITKMVENSDSSGNPVGLSSVYSITSPEISVDNLGFYASTPAIGAGQPSVFLVLKGQALVNATSISTFNIQTYISQRLLNI